MDDDHSKEALESREPSVEDLVELCRWLNEAGAAYIVIGGFAIRAAGYDRRTMAIDLLIEPTPANESKVFAALANLPDRAVTELTPGEVAEFGVIRIADEIVVDLMSSASGISFAEAAGDVEQRVLDGVTIPFASPTLLLRMKGESMRDKDAPDQRFLRQLLKSDPND